MSACCVSGCKNRHSSASKLKFYRIPSGNRPFQANRRRLWLQAIQQVNGSTEGLKGNVRICGAHFVSGEASMDHDSPDFVPSVFPCTKPSPKRKVKRFYGRRRRRRHKANVETEEIATPPRADSTEDLEPSVLMETESDLLEEIQTPPTSPVPKVGETQTKQAEAETGTRTMKQTTSSPIQTFKLPAGIPKLDKMSPIVLLKPLVAPTGGYECELCSQNFNCISQLVKHKQLHEEEKTLICEICGKQFTNGTEFTEHQRFHPVEPSFPCNMCDRSFSTSHNLKRHKLLHVKDGRKCSKCGVLFCQRHNHVLYLPQTESPTETEQDSPDGEVQNGVDNLRIENVKSLSLLEESEQSQTNNLDDNTKSSPPNPGPSPKTFKAPPPVSHTEKIPALFLPKSSTVPPTPVPTSPKKPDISSQVMPPPPNYPAVFFRPLPQHPELPSSLKIFSPQFLTSAFLEVKRNYDYILSKPKDVKKEVVKDEKCELPLIPPDEQSVEQVKKGRTAYDLEIVV